MPSSAPGAVFNGDVNAQPVINNIQEAGGLTFNFTVAAGKPDEPQRSEAKSRVRALPKGPADTVVVSASQGRHCQKYLGAAVGRVRFIGRPGAGATEMLEYTRRTLKKIKNPDTIRWVGLFLEGNGLRDGSTKESESTIFLNLVTLLSLKFPQAGFLVVELKCGELFQDVQEDFNTLVREGVTKLVEEKKIPKLPQFYDRGSITLYNEGVHYSVKTYKEVIKMLFSLK